MLEVLADVQYLAVEHSIGCANGFLNKGYLKLLQGHEVTHFSKGQGPYAYGAVQRYEHPVVLLAQVLVQLALLVIIVDCDHTFLLP